MDSLRVAEVVPNLGLPVLGPLRRRTLRKSKLPLGPGGPGSGLPKPDWGAVLGPGPRDRI